jgi:hypothetical protein
MNIFAGRSLLFPQNEFYNDLHRLPSWHAIRELPVVANDGERYLLFSSEVSVNNERRHLRRRSANRDFVNEKSIEFGDALCQRLHGVQVLRHVPVRWRQGAMPTL